MSGGLVYVMRAVGTDYAKIGYVREVARLEPRRREIQSCSPFLIRLEHVWRGATTWHEAIIRGIGWPLRADEMRGREWVYLTAAELELVISETREMDATAAALYARRYANERVFACVGVSATT